MKEKLKNKLKSLMSVFSKKKKTDAAADNSEHKEEDQVSQDPSLSAEGSPSPTEDFPPEFPQAQDKNQELPPDALPPSDLPSDDKTVQINFSAQNQGNTDNVGESESEQQQEASSADQVEADQTQKDLQSVDELIADSNAQSEQDQEPVSGDVSEEQPASNLTGTFTKISHALKKFKNIKSTGPGGRPPKDRFDLEQFVNKILDPNYRARIHQVFLLAFSFSFVYAMGKSMAVIARGVEQTDRIGGLKKTIEIPKNNLSKQLSQVRRDNIFRAKLSDTTNELAQVSPQEKKCIKATKSSTLPIQLMNTTVLQDTDKSVATIKISGQKDVLQIREGEKVQRYATMGRIDRLQVVLRNNKNGQCEFIKNKNTLTKSRKKFDLLTPSKGKELIESQKPEEGIKNVGNRYTISKKYIQEKFRNNPAALFRQAKAVKVQNDDGSIGFKITELAADSLYKSLGIEENDVIEGINGQKFQNEAQLLQMMTTMDPQNLRTMKLTIKRNGELIDRIYESGE